MSNDIPMEQQAGFDIRDSDIKLWETYTIRKPQTDGMKATLRADVYPAGWDEKEITGLIKGDNARQMMQAWFGYVKGRINAWENRKAAEETKRAEALAARSEREAAAPVVLPASNEAPAIYLPDREASLEDLLSSKVVALRGRLARVEDEIANARGIAEACQLVKAAIESELRGAERALGALGGDNEVGDSGKRGSEVHTGNGTQLPLDDSEADRGIPAGTGIVGRVPPRRGRPMGSRDSKPRVRAASNRTSAEGPVVGRIQGA